MTPDAASLQYPNADHEDVTTGCAFSVKQGIWKRERHTFVVILLAVEATL
jgi:hypothetical protein